MRRLIIHIIVSIAIIACIVAGLVATIFYFKNKENSQTSDKLLYTLSNDGTYYICDGIGDCESSIITIANTYNNLPVKEIGEKAFAGCNTIQSVTISDNIIKISDNAFLRCSALKSVTIPDSVTSIGERAFRFCSNLKDINISTNVTFIGKYAFDNCENLDLVVFKNTEGWYISSTEDVSNIEENIIDYNTIFEIVTANIYLDEEDEDMEEITNQITILNLVATDLADTSIAATYLTDTYCAYYWYKSN